MSTSQMCCPTALRRSSQTQRRLLSLRGAQSAQQRHKVDDMRWHTTTQVLLGSPDATASIIVHTQECYSACASYKATGLCTVVGCAASICMGTRKHRNANPCLQHRRLTCCAGTLPRRRGKIICRGTRSRLFLHGLKSPALQESE